ncbi:MAG TPA: hydantoinase B/oxoprolinase family protein, partial [Longimicrobiales bacterium]|nr:hydantoinase B/oxoprolinase family protein [Longimicrobiales bacterium]
MILNKELLADSAGAGRQRGGPGQVMTFKNTGDDVVNARVRPDKIFCAPPGLEGGDPGKTGEVRFNGEVITQFPILAFAPGDEIELRMPGGAGFGAAAQRDPSSIERDLADGIVTAEGARSEYGFAAGTRASDA